MLLLVCFSLFVVSARCFVPQKSWLRQYREARVPSAVSLHDGFWLRESASQQRQKIHFARVRQNHNRESPEPVLLLNGFGVGLFHWDRIMLPLAERCGEDVFGMDYLGQGSSWPVDCADGNAPSEQGLRYSIDDWVDQTVTFIEDQILASFPDAERVHLIGNSLGGLISTIVASRRPDLVCRVCLLNATPLWGGNLPGWDARLPGPKLPRAIGRWAYDRIRDPSNIRGLLEQTYHDEKALGDLPEKIRRVTDESAGGHAAFASIMWARPASIPGPNGDCGDFYDALRSLSCDTLLLYGAEDPWCSPEFGRAAFKALRERQGSPGQSYVELSPSGHCPHHEAPEATVAILSRWIVSSTNDSVFPLCLDGEEFSGVTATAIQDDTPRSLYERALTAALK